MTETTSIGKVPEKQLPVETQPKQLAEVEAYRQMDALDEQQMIDEQKGHVIDQYFYSFVVGGREIIGSSWAGIKFIASKMASLGHPIAVSELVIEEGQDSYKARAKAKDLTTGEERWGVAEQPKVDEKGRRNMFAYPIAASKAQRNAIRSFVSEVVIQEGYREWKKKRQATESTEPTKDTASVQQQAPRTSSTPESPVPSPASPTPIPVTGEASPGPQGPVQESRKPRIVPLTAELRYVEGVKLFPLEKHGRSYGTIHWAQDGSELSIVPEHIVQRDCAPVGSLIYGPRSKTFEGLEQMKSKHGFAYHVEVQDGAVKWILLQATREPIDEKHVKQLQSTARWAFENAPKAEDELGRAR